MFSKNKKKNEERKNVLQISEETLKKEKLTDGNKKMNYVKSIFYRLVIASI